jgi:NADPH-dependent 7-cyano-7-deazaguanine reductase QueF-like protein
MLLEIQKQIAELIAENAKGATALFETESALAQAEYDLDTAESKAFLGADGTVADRTAIARLKSAENRLQRDLRKAEHNRVKVKIKQIETALIALSTQAKLIGVETRM